MATGQWYPERFAERVPWHANLAAQASATGTAHGLTAGQVTQIGVDSDTMATLANWIEAVDSHGKAVTEFKDLVAEGDPGIAMPPLPTAVPNPLLGVGVQPSIEARTRQYAAIIKASVGYTDEIGQLYGIVGPAAPAPGTPALVGTPLTQSQVSLAVSKAGYSLIRIEGRRGSGGWEFLGVAQTATYIDARPPLVAGAPEQREYRAQGMANNVGVGAYSPIVSVVTQP